jgi:hypothetical protein
MPQAVVNYRFCRPGNTLGGRHPSPLQPIFRHNFMAFDAIDTKSMSGGDC